MSDPPSPPGHTSTRPEPPDRTQARLRSRVLLLLMAAVTLAMAWILQPFLAVLLWSVIIALLFAPVQRRLLARCGGRPSVAALLTLTLVLIIVILPLSLVAAALVREAAGVLARLQSGQWSIERLLADLFAARPGWISALLDRAGLVNVAALQQRLITLLSQASQTLATQALSLGQNALDAMLSLCLTVYLAFFLIRDGEQWAISARDALPLSGRDRRALFSKFVTVIRATVKGSLLVAAIQGALGGLAFWALGISAPVLWAVLMAFLSLLPAVGAALVWLPVAAYLFAIGSFWQGVALCVYGALLIGLVDNLLRPLLVGRDTRMLDPVVLITTLGGMAVFGIHGFVLGPAIGAMFIAVWHIALRPPATVPR